MNHKVVKIYEDSLDSISDSLDSISDSLDSISSPSPSVKIQIRYERESLLEVLGQNISGHCQQTF